MKELDSTALEQVNKALGLAGAGAQTTELEDGLVSQVLDVGHLIGRGRAPVSSNIAWAIFETTHAGADTQVVAVDPYFAGSAPGVVFNWPVPVPSGFDVWVFGATGLRVSGAAGVNTGYMGQVGDTLGDGAWGQRESGGAPGTTVPMRFPISAWDGFSSMGGQTFHTLNGDPTPQYRPTRVRRGSSLEVRMTSTGICVLQTLVLVGLFPVGLGQDAAS